jgi:hypothetical protein
VQSGRENREKVAMSFLFKKVVSEDKALITPAR